MFAALKRVFAKDPRQTVLDTLGDAPLPAFPRVAQDALAQLRDPKRSLNQVGSTLEQDPSLSVAILKTVNAPAYGLRRKVTRVGHAASMLGRGKLEGLITAVAVRQCSPARPAKGFQPRRFWRAAAHRASAARGLAQVLSPRWESEAFTAGLLQDLAIPLLAHRNTRYGDVLQQWQGDGGSLEALEQQAFGWDHAELGHALGSTWHFPEDLRDAIGGHHQDGAPGPVALVALFDEQLHGEDAVIEAARSRFNLLPDTTVQVLAQARAQGDELAALLA